MSGPFLGKSGPTALNCRNSRSSRSQVHRHLRIYPPPNSTPRSRAARNARPTSSPNPPASNTPIAAAVVPPLLVTDARSACASGSPSSSNRADPRIVCRTISFASRSASPSDRADSSIACASRNTYAGPDPLTAVTACISSSSTRTVWPTALRILVARSSSPALAPAPSAIPLMPSPMRQATLGMMRITLAKSPSARRIAPLSTPAMMLITTVGLDNLPIVFATSPNTCGFTASIIASASRAGVASVDV